MIQVHIMTKRCFTRGIFYVKVMLTIWKQKLWKKFNHCKALFPTRNYEVTAEKIQSLEKV